MRVGQRAPAVRKIMLGPILLHLSASCAPVGARFQYPVVITELVFECRNFWRLCWAQGVKVRGAHDCTAMAPGAGKAAVPASMARRDVILLRVALAMMTPRGWG